MKKKIWQYYSILLNKKTNLFIAFALGIFIVLSILIGGFLMNVFSGAGLGSLHDFVYQAMLMIIDPGFLAVDSGFLVGTVSLLVVLVGMIVFLGGSIGYISTVLSTYMDNIKGGSKKVFLYDHLLILNWNSRVMDMIAEECYKGETKNIFILVKEGRDDISKAIKKKQSQLKKLGKDYHPINCFVREGDLFSSHDLLDAGVKRAGTVIVLDDENSSAQGSGASMTPIKILMLLSKIQLGKEQTIIVEATNWWTKSLIEDIEAESEDSILSVSTNEILGKMLAQISIMPALNEVYGELMSHRGNEFYSLPTSFPADDKYSGIEAFMESHDQGVPLNIMEANGASYLFAMGADKGAIKKEGAQTPKREVLPVCPDYKQEPRKIVVIGKNSKQNYIYDCYDQYVTEHGLPSLHIHRISTEDGLEMVQSRPYISLYPIQDDYDKEGIQRYLKEILKMEKIHTILLLSNDMNEEQSRDTEVLIDLVNVKRILMDMDYEPELVVEILDQRHLDIASHYGIKSIVFSNQYVSRLITQFGDNKSLYQFFADLFAYDTDLSEIAAGRFRSKEIYVRKVGEVYSQALPRLTQRDLMVSTYYSSPKENPLILLGYIPADTKAMVLFGNQMDRIQVQLKVEDQIIVYCRH